MKGDKVVYPCDGTSRIEFRDSPTGALAPGLADSTLSGVLSDEIGLWGLACAKVSQAEISLCSETRNLSTQPSSFFTFTHNCLHFKIYIRNRQHRIQIFQSSSKHKNYKNAVFHCTFTHLLASY